MRLHEVRTQKDKTLFLEMAVALYRNDVNWIRPLDKDIEAVFDEQQNKFFKQGACSRWLLFNDAGEVIGRIAAFVNKQYKQEQATGGIGFFECIDDQQAANLMFDHCREWLWEKGMAAMDGPINFGERDRWWGLLFEGFDEPLYCMNYNPPYYIPLFETYGFRVYFEQICFGMRTTEPLQEKFFIRHTEIASEGHYTARTIDKAQLDRYAADFTYIYNKAWAGHAGNKQLEERTVRKLFQTLKPVMDPALVWFAYYKEEPVAMFVNIPDLNQYFKHLKGQFGLWAKFRFLLLKALGRCRRFVGLVFGVIPEHQGKGVDAYLIVEASKVIQAKPRYQEYEMQWIGDFNPKMLNIAESLGAAPTRKLATYRYLFDRTAVFTRHPEIGKNAN